MIFRYVIGESIWRTIALSKFENLESSRFYKQFKEYKNMWFFGQRRYKCACISRRADVIELKFSTDIYPRMIHLPWNFCSKILDRSVSRTSFLWDLRNRFSAKIRFFFGASFQMLLVLGLGYKSMEKSAWDL